jgi:hypothetical protein
MCWIGQSSLLTWHGVGPEADMVHEAKQHEAQKAQDVGLVEELPCAHKTPDQSQNSQALRRSFSRHRWKGCEALARRPVQ